ncbi:hypothetical protein PEBR_16841 [Penicillium brasilianum]|uniref:Xylanolytic transcriptional activator regulatory domain-containing protein n=1 Tax=Penicillium brasilianum TaxID=104259 RepID=A0A1S9RUP0_PENBI|nr:hypothetical protein PEBR_16841 [Penicillium brasilianum]
MVSATANELCHYDYERDKYHQSPYTQPVDSGPSASSSSTNTGLPTPETSLASDWASKDQSTVSNFGYSSQSSHHTLALLRATEQYTDHKHTSTGSSGTNYNASRGIFQSDADRKFKELVRHLPSQPCIDVLIQTFFYGVNWQYDLIDEEHFREQLDAWGQVSYSALQAGCGTLAPEMRVFPALLFQVLAHALLFHPPQDERVKILLTMAEMTFYDLGVEFSDGGAEILTLLGKTGITIGTVQAGLLRASFLKSSGKVIEAWHTLGATIRDAQEIGLHTGQLMSDQSSDLSENGAMNARESYIGHKIWVVLHIWDIHMAVVLGRPIVTDLNLDDFTRTVTNDEKRRELFSHWQKETDPPRAFDVILAGYNVAYRYFPQIHRLGQNGARAQDYTVVESIHTALKKNLELLPSWCQLEDPDTTFDQMPGCHWLPLAREGLSSLIHLVFLTLHRPYIFATASSRTEALKAGIAILRAQERLFQRTELQSCKIFNPVYASFDALVLIAAICIAFPNQGLEQLTECIQVLERGVERLEAIGQFNPMARSAHAVAWNLYRQLQHHLTAFGTAGGSRDQFSNTDLAFLNGDPDYLMGKPSELSFNNVSPPNPTQDLFYDHLSISQITRPDAPNNLPFDPLTVDCTDGWDFEGTFADTSFWSLMNEFNLSY